jgi:DNA-binding transcriptional MerR regulator
MSAVSERAARPLTIGAVCRHLKEEFPDVSISKIRYLEDQGLLMLRRTHGGYRLFSEDDVERLRTILRLQRDEFLPLRVIREELTVPGRGKRDRRRGTQGGIRSRLDVPSLTFEELCERAGADPAFVRELGDYGILEAEEAGYPETDAAIVALCARLARYGVAPRNLRAIRTGIDREAALIEAVVAPALRSRNPERRHGGLEELEALAALTLELSQALFWRSLRGVVARA